VAKNNNSVSPYKKRIDRREYEWSDKVAATCSKGSAERTQCRSQTLMTYARIRVLKNLPLVDEQMLPNPGYAPPIWFCISHIPRPWPVPPVSLIAWAQRLRVDTCSSATAATAAKARQERSLETKDNAACGGRAIHFFFFLSKEAPARLLAECPPSDKSKLRTRSHYYFSRPVQIFPLLISKVGGKVARVRPSDGSVRE